MMLFHFVMMVLFLNFVDGHTTRQMMEKELNLLRNTDMTEGLTQSEHERMKYLEAQLEKPETKREIMEEELHTLRYNNLREGLTESDHERMKYLEAQLDIKEEKKRRIWM